MGKSYILKGSMIRRIFIAFLACCLAILSAEATTPDYIRGYRVADYPTA